MKTIRQILAILLSQAALLSFGQIGINTDGSSPAPSAILDVKSTTMGVILPRMTNAERDAIVSPAEGLIIFNIEEKKLQLYDGTVWTYVNLDSCVPPMPGNISGPTHPDCNQTGVSYSIASVPWASYYSWLVPSGATIVGGQGTTSILVDFSTQNAYIYVCAESGCGNSMYRILPITIGIPATPGSITGQAYPECNSSGIAYSIDAVPGATNYTWTLPPGATMTGGQGTTSILVDYASVTSGNISVRAENSCGNSSYSTLSVVVAIPATPGSISGNITPDINATGEVYSISEVNGAASYHWTVPSGAAIISGQGTTSIVVDFGTTSGDISVRAENNCGNSSYRTLTITLFECGNQVYDERDGHYYNTVLIGSQCWFAENINIGTQINTEFDQLNNGLIEKYCYNNEPDSCDNLGGLYLACEALQYSYIEGTQGICLPGWHIPSDDEWKILEGTVDSQYGVGDPVWDDTDYRGYDAGYHLKSLSKWISGAEGDDLYGFNALPAGFRDFEGTYYWGEATTYWSSSVINEEVWRRNLIGDDVYRMTSNLYDIGRSIRCIKD